MEPPILDLISDLLKRAGRMRETIVHKLHRLCTKILFLLQMPQAANCAAMVLAILQAISRALLLMVRKDSIIPLSIVACINVSPHSDRMETVN